MGGALAIASAVLVPGVDAVVAFYGVPSPELADPALAKAPVQAHFGELDNFVGFSDVTVRSFRPFLLSKNKIRLEKGKFSLFCILCKFPWLQYLVIIWTNKSIINFIC